MTAGNHESCLHIYIRIYTPEEAIVLYGQSMWQQEQNIWYIALCRILHFAKQIFQQLIILWAACCFPNILHQVVTVNAYIYMTIYHMQRLFHSHEIAQYIAVRIYMSKHSLDFHDNQRKMTSGLIWMLRDTWRSFGIKLMGISCELPHRWMPRITFIG